MINEMIEIQGAPTLAHPSDFSRRPALTRSPSSAISDRMGRYLPSSEVGTPGFYPWISIISFIIAVSFHSPGLTYLAPPSEVFLPGRHSRLRKSNRVSERTRR
jgi:hypothetical protein